jgi:hypothetical protein
MITRFCCLRISKPSVEHEWQLTPKDCELKTSFGRSFGLPEFISVAGMFAG